jgi:mRNA interferase RelE/StbE
MARYRLTFKKSVARDLRALPKNDVKRILKRIEALADEPRGDGCSKLSGQGFYRVRVGVYRVVYEIEDGVLTIQVIRIAHRARVYR